MVENVEESLQRFMPLAALGNVVDKSRRQWRVHAIQAQQPGAHGCRAQRLAVVDFDGLQFTGRKAHAGVRAKAYRVVRRVAGAAQGWMARQGLLEQLAEPVQTRFGHPPFQRFEQSAGFQPGIR
ncbi:hypothetical protein D3C71_1620090 [compost metagenome]